MSQENVEVVRRATQHLNDTGEVLAACFDPEVEYRTMPDAPVQYTYRGISGLQRSVASVQEVWETMEIEEREIIESDDAVVAMWHYRLRGHSGVELEVEQGWAYWIRGGRIWRMHQYASKEAALEAAGLRG